MLEKEYMKKDKGWVKPPRKAGRVRKVKKVETWEKLAGYGSAAFWWFVGRRFWKVKKPPKRRRKGRPKKKPEPLLKKELRLRKPEPARIGLGGPPPSEKGAKKKALRPATYNPRITKKLVPRGGAIDLFYRKTEAGRTLENYLRAAVERQWKQTRKSSKGAMPERQQYVLVFHRVFGSGNILEKKKGITRIIPDMLKKYSRRKRDVTDYMLALVKKRIYETLIGKRKKGKGMLRKAGFSSMGKIESGQLQVTMGDSDSRALRRYIKLFVLTPVLRGK